MANSITPAQIKRIHTLKTLLKTPDAAYRSMLRDYHAFSSKQLSEDQADTLIWELQKVAEAEGVWTRPGRKFQQLAGRKGMATPKQLRMIDAMWTDVSRTTSAESRRAALAAFLRRYGCNDGLEGLEYWQVSKVINALEAMKAQRPAPPSYMQGAST
ncbi:MAG TPA: DUF1018 domain-containing protein, partial [Elusimicrobiales bacterium]|nr:DUF1018 domain-containing protein [Elusimicrobiales bacterium]